jgi:hypothetical protein
MARHRDTGAGVSVACSTVGSTIAVLRRCLRGQGSDPASTQPAVPRGHSPEPGGCRPSAGPRPVLVNVSAEPAQQVRVSAGETDGDFVHELRQQNRSTIVPMIVQADDVEIVLHGLHLAVDVEAVGE